MTIRRRTPCLRGLVPILLPFALGACGTPQPGGPLYERLGGSESIAQIVDDLIVTVQDDPRLRDRFKNADLPRLRQRLGERLCALSGGPCSDAAVGPDAAPDGLKLAGSEFDAFVGDLAKSLDEHDVGPREQRELLFALKARQAEVVASERR